MSYKPKTRLEKILSGVNIAARNGLEKAVAAALAKHDPLEVAATSAANESEKTVITFDKTAEEVYNAVLAGRPIKTTFSITVEEETVIVEKVITIAALKGIAGDEVGYDFRIADSDGKAFFAEGLAGADPVVLTEV